MSANDAKAAASLAIIAVAAYYGGPYGAIAASALTGFLLAPEAETATGPRLDNLQLSLSRYGDPIKVIYGAARIGGTYSWATDIVERVNTKREGGGLFTKGTKVRTFTYFGNFALDLCESPAALPVEAVAQIFGNTELIADFVSETGPVLSIVFTGKDTLFNSGSIRIQLGEEDQVPDVLIESDVGVGNTPAGRGLCRITFDLVPLAPFNNAVPQITAVASTKGTPIWPTISADVGIGYWMSDNVHMISSGIDKWNLVTQEAVVQGVALAVSGGITAIDKFDNFYNARADGGGLVLSMHKYSGDTFQHLGSTEDGATDIVVAFGQSVPFGVFHESLFVVGGSPQDDKISIIDTLGFDMQVKINYGLTADFGMASKMLNRQVTVDKDGFVWGSILNGSDTDLVKFDRNMGIPFQIFPIVGLDAGNLGYDEKTHSLFFFAAGTCYKWDITTETLDPKSVVTGQPVHTLGLFRFGGNDGFIFAQTSLGITRNMTKIDLTNMTIVEVYEIGDGSKWGDPNVESPIYIPITNALVLDHILGGPEKFAFLDRVTIDSVTLETILDDLVDRTGEYVSGTDSDTTEHASTLVPGYIVGQRSQIMAAASQLGQYYNFGFVESDHLMKFPSRGSATILTLTDKDLGVTDEDGESPPKVLIKRLPDDTLPLRIETTYMDPTFDYQTNMQPANRIAEIVETARVVKRTFALVLDNDDARRRTEVALHTIWTDRNQYEFSTFPRFLKLDPGDTIVLTANGRSHAVTIVSTDMGTNGIIEFVGVGFPLADQAEADALLAALQTLSATLGGTAESHSLQEIVAPNPPRVEYADTTLVSDDDSVARNEMGTYASMRGLSAITPWAGGIIDRSPDNSDYSSWSFYPKEQEGGVGLAETILADHVRWTIFDEVNTVDVNLGPGTTLVSVPDLDIYNGKNRFLSGDEHFQAGVVSDLGSGTWRLSHLLRGRRGTEWAIPNHVLNERVIYFGNRRDAEDNFIFKRTALSDRNTEFFYKAITLDDPTETGFIRTLTSIGRTNMPYAPAAFVAAKVVDDWVFDWTRRTRVGGELISGTGDVLLSENFEAYELDVYDEANVNVVRIITSTASENGSVVTPGSQTAIYTVADQILDFGAGPPSFYPKFQINSCVYQMSKQVGRGFARCLVQDSVPSSGLDVNFDKVVLLCHGDIPTVGLDRSRYQHTMTKGTNAFIDLDEFKWPPGSMKTGGSNNRQFKTASKFEFGFGTHDWTVEYWFRYDVGIEIKPSSVGGETYSGHQAFGAPDNGWYLRRNAPGGNHFQFVYSTTGSNAIVLEFDDPTVQLILDANNFTTGDVWQHMAWCRATTNIHLFIDGVEDAVSPVSIGTDDIFRPSTDLFIGGDGRTGLQQHFQGSIDDYRITVGLARYTANFAVPDLPYPDHGAGF